MASPPGLWEGLTELMQQFGELPEQARRGSMAVVRKHTEAAAQEIRDAYEEGPTGNLKKGVKTEFPSTTIAVGIIRSRSPHAHLYEFGTQLRTYKGNDLGYGGGGEAGAPHPVTVPIVRRHREEMEDDLAEMLSDLGFDITRTAA